MKTAIAHFPFELPEMLVVAVLDRRKSTYVMDGTGETGENGLVIDTSTSKMIKRISDVMVFNDNLKKWEVKQIRYLQGCPTIWVEEQETLKFKTAQPANSAIWLENGALSFGVEGFNIQKAMFLMLHENNGSFTGNENYRRPSGAADVFFQIDTERDAAKEVADFDYDIEAKMYLRALKKSDNRGLVTYNTDKLEFLASLFKLGAYESEAGGRFGAETFMALVAIANDNPKRFISTIGKYEAVVEADVNRALSTGVVLIQEAFAVFADSGKQIMTFPDVRMIEAEKRKALLDFMLNPENRLMYEQMRALTAAGLSKEAAIITE